MSLRLKEKINEKSSTKERVASFIRKTYQILEEGKHSDIVDWNEEGTAIVIKNTAMFAEHVLPIYFKHNNFTSFVRQVFMSKIS